MDNITSENHQLREEIVDLKSRSMRDNLLFFNFAEQKTNRKMNLASIKCMISVNGN